MACQLWHMEKAGMALDIGLELCKRAHLLLCLPHEVCRREGDVPASNVAGGGAVQVVRIDAGEKRKIGSRRRVVTSIRDV